MTRLLFQPGELMRRRDELWVKWLSAVGLKTRLEVAQWSTNLQAVQSGKFMV